MTNFDKRLQKYVANFAVYLFGQRKSGIFLRFDQGISTSCFSENPVLDRVLN